MKIPKQNVDNLITLIEHAQSDISYEEGGTYNDGFDNFDTKAAKKAQLAIELFIKQNIINRD